MCSAGSERRSSEAAGGAGIQVGDAAAAAARQAAEVNENERETQAKDMRDAIQCGSRRDEFTAAAKEERPVQKRRKPESREAVRCVAVCAHSRQRAEAAVVVGETEGEAVEIMCSAQRRVCEVEPRGENGTRRCGGESTPSRQEGRQRRVQRYDGKTCERIEEFAKRRNVHQENACTQKRGDVIVNGIAGARVPRNQYLVR